MNEEGEMTDLERLARAAAERAGLDWDAMPERVSAITQEARSTRAWWRETVRAVLNALLPPSEGMIEAIARALCEMHLGDKEAVDFVDYKGKRQWQERTYIEAATLALTAAIHSILGKEPL